MKRWMKGFRYVSNLPEKNQKIWFKALMVALVFSGLGACSADKTESEYIQSAKSYLESGDSKSAVIELKNAIQANSSNPESRYLLANYYLSQQQGAQAEKELQKAIDAGYPASELVNEFTRAYYYQYKFDDLIATSIQLDSLSDEDKSEVLFLRGLVNLALRRKPDAQADFEESARTTSDIYGKLAHAYNLAISEQIDEAILITLAVLKENPDLAEASILASRLFFTKQDLEKAIDYLEKAIASEPNRLQLYVDLARYQSMAQDFESAEKNIDIILKIAPNHLPSNLIKAGLRLRSKDFEEAKVHAEMALAVSEVNKQAKLLSGMANFYLENWEASRNRLKAVVPFTPDGHVARRMLAYTEFKLGYAQNADDILNSIGQAGKSDTSLLSEFGSQMAKRGDVDEALKLYGKAAEISPENTAIKTQLGFLKLQQNNLDGISDLESVIDLDKDAVWARSGLVGYYLSTQNYAKAEKLSRSLIATKPNETDGYILSASVYVAQKQFKNALKVLNEGLAKIPDNVKLLVEKAKISAYMDKDQDAQKYIAQALEVSPNDKNALVANYRLGKKLGNIQKPLALIKKAKESGETDDSYTLLYSLMLIDQGNRQKAYAVLATIPKTSRQFTRSQLAMGNIKAEVGEFERAIEHFDTVIGLDNQLKAAYLGKIESQIRIGKLEEALASIERARKAFPSEKQIQLKEIELLLQLDRSNQAKSKIGRFSAVHGPSKLLEIIRGQHAARSGDNRSALQFFQNAHKIAPTTRSLISIAQMYAKLQQRDSAVNLVKDWLKAHPKDMAVKMYYANLNLETDHSAAIVQYRQLLRENGNNLIALNNLAWALGEQGSIQEALAYAERAYKLKAVPPVIDTYAFLLFQNGEHEQALPLLKLAHEKAASDHSIAYHYALALNQAGNQGEAKALLQKISKEKFPEVKKAKALLKQIDN